MVTVLAGTSLLIRMIDTVDSSKNAIGSRFTATLESNLEVGGNVVAPAGTKVYGRLAQSKEAGRMAGKSELRLDISLRQKGELRVKKVSKPQERAERLLIAEARTGSPDAFADLVRIYSPRIYNISLKILRNSADAEDNVQNVLWKAHRNMRGFEGRSRFSTWLFRIAVNEALMRIRECRPESLSVGLLKPDSEEASLHYACDRHPDPERQCIAKDLAKKAFGGLSPSRVDLFIRNTVEGWTQRELAHEVGITVSAVKSRIFHARAHMQEQLDALS